jgi:hypothetical protein
MWTGFGTLFTNGGGEDSGGASIAVPIGHTVLAKGDYCGPETMDFLDS